MILSAWKFYKEKKKLIRVFSNVNLERTNRHKLYLSIIHAYMYNIEITIPEHGKIGRVSPSRFHQAPENAFLIPYDKRHKINKHNN